MAATAAQRRGIFVHQAAEAAERESVGKNLLLFFAAPLIGLAYIIVFPFVGCYALAKVASRRQQE